MPIYPVRIRLRVHTNGARTYVIDEFVNRTTFITWPELFTTKAAALKHAHKVLGITFVKERGKS